MNNLAKIEPLATLVLNRWGLCNVESGLLNHSEVTMFLVIPKDEPELFPSIALPTRGVAMLRLAQ